MPTFSFFHCYQKVALGLSHIISRNLLFLCALKCVPTIHEVVSSMAKHQLLRVLEVHAMVVICRKTSASLSELWVESGVFFFFSSWNWKAKCGGNSYACFLDLVIWQTFSQDWMPLAYCFKENDLPIVIASNKIEISTKTYSSCECVSFTGNLGSHTWPEDFSNEITKTWYNVVYIVMWSRRKSWWLSFQITHWK